MSTADVYDREKTVLLSRDGRIFHSGGSAFSQSTSQSHKEQRRPSEDMQQMPIASPCGHAAGYCHHKSTSAQIIRCRMIQCGEPISTKPFALVSRFSTAIHHAVDGGSVITTATNFAANSKRKRARPGCRVRH